jgi:polyhydroxybutyrate depolymerase
MKHATATVLMGLGLLACNDTGTNSTATYSGGDFYESVQVGQVRRWYRLHVPTRSTPGPLAPLIVAYHGFGQSAEGLEAQTGLDAAADAAGAIVAYPEAYYGTWDVNGELEELFQVEDIAFTRAIIAQVRATRVVDRRRVVAVGLSNGAVFVHRLACLAADDFAGFVTVAGAMLRNVAATCHPLNPMSVLHILGTEDGFFAPSGSSAVFPADSGVAFWAGKAGCGGGRRNGTLPDTAGDGMPILTTTWTGCPEGVAVSMVRITGGGHAWPGATIPPNEESFGRMSRSFSASRAVMDFARSVVRR